MDLNPRIEPRKRRSFAWTLCCAVFCLGCQSAPLVPEMSATVGTASGLEYRSPAKPVGYVPELNSEFHLEANGDFATSETHRSGHTFREEAVTLLPRIWHDAKGIANWNNGMILGLSLAGAVGIRQGLDDDVRENTTRHPERWGDGSKAIGRLGEAQYQVAGLLLYRAIALHSQDEFHRNLSRSLLSAFTITGLSTLTVKAIANTDRPSEDWNGGQFGFPSFHAASSFAIASVLDEYYGPKFGLPAYGLAGLIGWSRIDERDHDLSDVVFGAALGYVIGKSVAGLHLRDDSRIRLLPFVHSSESSTGLAVEVSY